jgi:hypothetical protein
MSDRTAHRGGQLLFVLLSLADLALTWWLLGRPDGEVYEGNPVARYWLLHHGWLGLACFKGAQVLLVLLLAATVARWRPRAGRRVLTFGCAALALVVLYSASLCRAVARQDREVAAARAHSWALDGQIRETAAYQAALAELAEDLRAGRCTLHQAAERAAATEKGRDPAWRQALAALYPGRAPEECFAANVICHAMWSRLPPSGARALARKLEREFQLTYGSTPPPRPDMLRWASLREGTATRPAS